MNWTRLLILTIFVPVTLHAADAADGFDFNLHIAITTMRKAGPPELHGRTVIFSYKPKIPARYVGISLDYEDFGEIHPFVRNEFGVYVFLLEAPESIRDVTYRYVVDGLWMTDPNNDAVVEDLNGHELSYFKLDGIPEAPFRSPVVLADGIVEFNFRYPENNTVYVAGSFNNWDPFMHKLTEISPGTYSTRIRMSSGTHHYYFIVNGKRTTDPLNAELEVDEEGFGASLVRLR